ncbi:MAG TPA: hypothetical protein PK765_04000 [bacterium]|nr:hypothetical protein [bacterium]
MIFAAIADSVSSDHETGDVVLPNVILPPDSSDGQALPPIFLDLYPDQDDLLYEDSFGLSIGGIALDAVLLDKPSEEDMNRLRSSQADAILDRLYSIVATHRVGGYESVFLPVLALRKRDSRSNIDPADSLGRTISFLRDSFA